MVALNVWPTDAAAGSVANEEKWRKMARHWAASGVLDNIGGELAPSYAASTVTVQSGAAWVDGHFVEVPGSQAVPVTTGGLVVIRFDPVANAAELIYRDAAALPTQNPTGVWELLIARMAGGVMTDMRTFAGPEVLPWSAAWGRVQTVVLTTASGNAGPEVDVNAAAIAWTPVPGRIYSVGVRIPRVVQATSAGECRVRITDAANTGKGTGSQFAHYLNGNNFSTAVILDSYETGLAGTSTTRKARTSNTGPGHTFDFAIGMAGLFWVADIGPAGARPTALESLEWLESPAWLDSPERAAQLEAEVDA